MQGQQQLLPSVPYLPELGIRIPRSQAILSIDLQLSYICQCLVRSAFEVFRRFALGAAYVRGSYNTSSGPPSIASTSTQRQNRPSLPIPNFPPPFVTTPKYLPLPLTAEKTSLLHKSIDIPQELPFVKKKHWGRCGGDTFTI
jgi:hypothetical protein